VTDPSAIICPAQVRVWRLLPISRPSFAKPQAPQHLFPVTAGIAVAVQSKRRSIGCRKDLDNLLPSVAYQATLVGFCSWGKMPSISFYWWDVLQFATLCLILLSDLLIFFA
jgi:hypothetical protein